MTTHYPFLFVRYVRQTNLLLLHIVYRLYKILNDGLRLQFLLPTDVLVIAVFIIPTYLELDYLCNIAYNPRLVIHMRVRFLFHCFNALRMYFMQEWKAFTLQI